MTLHFGQSGQLEASVMERVLLQLKTLPHLWVVPALTTAWSTLITHPFIKGITFFSNTTNTTCYKNTYILLLYCWSQEKLHFFTSQCKPCSPLFFSPWVVDLKILCCSGESCEWGSSCLLCAQCGSASAALPCSGAHSTPSSVLCCSEPASVGPSHCCCWPGGISWPPGEWVLPEPATRNTNYYSHKCRQIQVVKGAHLRWSIVTEEKKSVEYKKLSITKNLINHLPEHDWGSWHQHPEGFISQTEATVCLPEARWGKLLISAAPHEWVVMPLVGCCRSIVAKSPGLDVIQGITSLPCKSFWAQCHSLSKILSLKYMEGLCSFTVQNSI